MDSTLIYEIEDSLPGWVCKEMIRRFEASPDKQKRSRIGVTADHEGILDLERRDSFEIAVSDEPEWKDIDGLLFKALHDAVEKYKHECAKFAADTLGEDYDFIKTTQFGSNNEFDTGYIVQRVTPESWFRWHHDFTRDDRYLTCIWYLNDLSEEDGGATQFLCGRSVQPKEGKLLLFPATWTNIHSGKFIHKTKYICTAAFHFSP